MRGLLPFLILATVVTAGCTTTTPYAGDERGIPRAMTTKLQTCHKMRVSNAPRVDRKGYLTDFSPFIRVNRVSIARAPTRACLSSGFGPRRGGAGRFHKGIDLFTGQPRAIVAAGDGVVEEVRRRSGFGRTVLIRHPNGVFTRYAHLSRYGNIRPGQRVRFGEYIGMTGRSGNATAIHLHFEILNGKRQINPLR